MLCKDYQRAKTKEDALALLSDCGEAGLILAGGTDILLKARKRNWYAQHVLVDIDPLSCLRGISLLPDGVRIGALTTVTDLLNSSVVKKRLPLLHKACACMGTPQIRNRATIGGNLANSCLGGDLIPPLVVHKAKLSIESASGTRTVEAGAFLKPCKACLAHEEINTKDCFYGIPSGKKNVLTAKELITAIFVPFLDNYDVFFEKIGRKAAGCMSVFTFSLAVKHQKAYVEDIRLSLGSALETVSLLPQVNTLIGEQATPKKIEEIANTLEHHLTNIRLKNSTLCKYKAAVGQRLFTAILSERLLEGDA